MGIKELALTATISSSLLVACQPAKPPELTPTHPIPPQPIAENPAPTIPPLPEPIPKFPVIPEATATKEAEKPTVIWFMGSSTVKNFDLIVDYLRQVFPEPKFRFDLRGIPGAQIEDLTSEVKDDILIPAIDEKPCDPANVNFIVIFGGANDLFANESIVSMDSENIDLFTTLSEKYPNAKFIYIKPYHLNGIYTIKNPAINDFNRSFSASHLINEVKKHTGRTISIATVDINDDLDKCDPKLIQCFLDDRHAGPPILKDIVDRTKAIIDPPPLPKPKPASFLYPRTILWSYNEQSQRKMSGSRRLIGNFT